MTTTLYIDALLLSGEEIGRPYSICIECELYIKYSAEFYIEGVDVLWALLDGPTGQRDIDPVIIEWILDHPKIYEKYLKRDIEYHLKMHGLDHIRKEKNMKYKFKINEIVKYKTQHDWDEPFQIISRYCVEEETEKYIAYTLRNSRSHINFVTEVQLEKEKYDRKNKDMAVIK